MSGNYSFSEVDYPALFFAEFLFQLSTKCWKFGPAIIIFISENAQMASVCVAVSESRYVNVKTVFDLICSLMQVSWAWFTFH